MNELTPLSKNIRKRQLQAKNQITLSTDVKKYFFKKYQKPVQIIRLLPDKIIIQVPTAALASNIQLEKEFILTEINTELNTNFIHLYIRIG